MAILRYKDLVKAQTPRKALLNFMESAYRTDAQLADCNIKKLEVPALYKKTRAT